MSSLIKASAAAVQPIHSFGMPELVELAQESSPQEPLLDRISELEAELGELKAALPNKVEQAQKEGARKALEARTDTEAKALEALKATTAAALLEWKDRLGSWDSLATGIARAVLEQVFTETGSDESHLANAIRTRLAKLDAAAVVRVRVSSDNFPDSETLSQFASQLGNANICADCKLPSGSCVIDLQLGEIEVGPAAQWRRIEALLDQIEREAGPR